VKLYQDHQRDGYGAIIVQANVEDTRLGVQEYAIKELGVEVVELKWGQGAKNIGGEVKIKDLKKAQLLYERGYVVLPDPTDPNGHQGLRARGLPRVRAPLPGRHGRGGGLRQRVEELRKAGAKYVFLKTGAYRPADLARAIAWSSKYKIDMLTVDGAGGGTGMSPWRMMNEWGMPPVELHSLLYTYAKKLDDKKAPVPALASPAASPSKTRSSRARHRRARSSSSSGWRAPPSPRPWSARPSARPSTSHRFPSTSSDSAGPATRSSSPRPSCASKWANDEFEKLPTGAIGLYTYYERLAQGATAHVRLAEVRELEPSSGRDDLAALTREAADVSGLSRSSAP
jgi:hypothetical protein